MMKTEFMKKHLACMGAFFLVVFGGFPTPAFGQDAPPATPNPPVSALETALVAAAEASSPARQRLAMRRVIRDAEAVLAPLAGSPDRFPVLEFLFRARQRLVALDDDTQHRMALLETARELVKAPDEHAGLRLEADLLLSQAELAKQGADAAARAEALRPFVNRYIETPATIWQAESVLIDEVSRCKPEHQNRLCSLVHERRIQGLALPKLRYRWAAMNPCEAENSDDFYEGSVALDQALADRFAFVIEVPDWEGLTEADRQLVADARGVDVQSIDQVGLARAVEEGRRRFAKASDELHQTALAYSAAVATQLLQPAVRLSPRRVRMLSRNLVALTLISGGQPQRDVFLTGLTASLPQLAWGVRVADPVVRGAHAAAWDLLTQGPQVRWLSQVLLETDIAKRCKLLFQEAPSRDTATLAIRQSLVQLPKAHAAVLALALLPVVRDQPAAFGEESLAAVMEVAAPILEIEGEAKWKLRSDLQPKDNPHPMLSECAALLESLPPRRRERARQLFYHCIVREIPIAEPAELEQHLDRAIRAVSSHLKSTTSCTSC